MRSLSIVCLFILVSFGHSRSYHARIAQFLKQHRRDENNYTMPSSDDRENYPPVTISYDFPAKNASISVTDQLVSEGANGYVYLGFVMDKKYASQNVFVNLNGWSSEYSYEFLPQPDTGDQLLSQLLVEGSGSYRLKRRIFALAGNSNGYVKNLNRPEIQYTYRYLPPPDDTDVLLKQLNEQGAEGYRYWGFYNNDGFSSLFIKDLSQDSAQYVYAPLSNFPATSAEFIQKTNELGKQGYRFVTSTYLVSQTKTNAKGRPLIWTFPIYYKDQSRSKIYRYIVLPSPTTLPDYINRLKEQADQGYLFITTQTFSNGEQVDIYFDWRTGKDDTLDIDGAF